MTLSTTTVRATILGSGSAGPFAFPFKIFAATDLTVQKIGTTGLVTALNYPTDYTIPSGIGNASGGTLTLAVALANGESLSILRTVPNTQPTSFRSLGTFFPASHEDEFDRLTMLVQQNTDAIKRSARIVSALDPSAVSMELTPVTGQVLGWASPTQLSTFTLDSAAVGVPGGGRTVATATAFLANNALFNVKDYGAKGDGTTDDTASFQNAAGAAGASGIASVGPNTHRISSNLFLTSPLSMGPGTILKPDSGVSIFIEAAFVASCDKHFDLSAGGKVLFNSVAAPVVYPEWWGAKGDGSTDDTAAIQAAIDSRAYNNAHTGGVVECLSSSYKYSALNLTGTIGNGAGVWLRSSGRYSTTLITTTTNAVAISGNGAGCRLTDCRLQTAVGTTPVAGQVLFQSTLGANVVVERVDCYKFYCGFQLSGAHAKDCTLDYGLAGGIGVHLPDSIGSTLEDIVINPRYNMSAAFLLEGVTGQPDTNLFTRCSTNAGQIPTQWATYGTTNTGVAGIATSVRMSKQAGGNPPRWNRFTDCLFETTANASFIHAFDYQAGHDTKIIGGYILGGTVAFAMQGASTNYINDHMLIGTIIFGAQLQGVVHNPTNTTQPAPLSLIDCTVVDNSNAGVGFWEGIQLGANSRGFTMRGGSCGASPGTASQQVQGINVVAGAQDYWIDVDSIDLTGNTSVPTAGMVPTVASAGSITPVSRELFISGTAAIATIIVPRRFRRLIVYPTGIFTWTAGDNIAVAGTAVVGKRLEFQYVQSTGKWYPSYTA